MSGGLRTGHASQEIYVPLSLDAKTHEEDLDKSKCCGFYSINIGILFK